MEKRILIELFIMITIIVVLKKSIKENARKEANTKILEYGIVFRIFIILLNLTIFGSLIFLVIKVQIMWYAIILITLWLLSLISFFNYFTFFVKLSYDEIYIYYSGIKV